MSRGILKLFKYFFIALLLFGCTSVTKSFFEEESKSEPVQVEIKQNEVLKKEEKKEVVEEKQIKETPKKEITKKETIKTQEIQKEKKPEVKKVVQKEPVEIKEETERKLIRTSTTLEKKNLKEFAFDLIQKGKTDENTLLLVGGIQGDEPGGFMAASLISTHYVITKGSVWIVPNLNFYAIIKRSRGPFGDMNRKFADLSPKDPEYEIVQRVKSYITNPNVKLILNLHDGSGFYRPMYIDKNHQPNKWGQTVVIDQEILHNENVKKYKDLYTIASDVVNHTNKHLLKDEDIYRIKNTHTRFKNSKESKEMAKTLTYFAINSGKAAFGHETSKSLNVTKRVYYKLLAIEKFMDIMGIEYQRKFDLTVNGVERVLEDEINLTFDDTNINMPLKDLRNIQKFFPIDENGVVKFLPSNPLIKIIKNKDEYTIYYGNRRLTKLQADYAKHLSFETKVDIIIDGKLQKVKFGDTIDIKKSFNVIENGFRVNVIGYKSKDGVETGKNIKKSHFIKRYSVQKKGDLYRIEFYKGKKFAGMILVNFIK